MLVEGQGNDEIQMTNDKGMTNPELGKIVANSASSFEHWDFLRAWSLIRSKRLNFA
jgi:hypothetical protein